MLKKIFFVSVLLVLLISLAPEAYAQAWIKSGSNPLNINLIDNYTDILQAPIYKNDGLYKGTVTAKRQQDNYYSLVEVESDNGKDWQMKKVLLNTGQELSNSRIFIDTDGSTKLLLTRQDNSNFYRIYYTECDNNLNCSSAIDPLLDVNQSDLSEKNGYFAPYIIKIDGTYFLFYGVWGNDGFKIRMALSSDFQNWQKCPNNLITGGDGPFVYLENQFAYILYHRSDSSGIKLSKTGLPLTCSSVFEDLGYQITKSAPYDSRHLIYPSLINEDGQKKLFYSGLGDDFRWRLNVACSNQLCLFTTPTPTATPTLSPTPYPLHPIVIIPGLMASWNKEAILHNSYSADWILNPLVKDYQGIIQTLKNIGYKDNENLFFFNYDWRKNIDKTADDLNSFLNQITSNQSPVTNFYIVGHSLGGLTSRIYSRKYQNQNLKKIATVASPHKGVSQVYKAVEAGEIDRFNDYLWLALKLVIALNRNNFETDRQTINRVFPALQDLFPVYNFIRKSGSETDYREMKIKNPFLSNESNETNLISIVGEKGPTLKGYNVTAQSILDKLLGNYPDGRPLSSYNELGDYLVLSSSASLVNKTPLNYDHAEIIYKKESIKKILELLDIPYQESDLVEGGKTELDSSLIFLIKSSAVIEVKYDDQVYFENNGLIFIENARSGNYQLKVSGIEKGYFQILIGQIGKNTDIWETLNGEITEDPPTSQAETYEFAFNPDNPAKISGYLDPLILFDDLLSYFKTNPELAKARQSYEKKQYSRLKIFLLSLNKKIVVNNDYIGLEKLENLYGRIFSSSPNFPSLPNSPKILQLKLVSSKKLFNLSLIKLSKQKLNNRKVIILNTLSKKLDLAEKHLQEKKYPYAEIVLFSVENLLKKL